MQKGPLKIVRLLLFYAVILAGACTSTSVIPQQTEDGWQTASLEQVGLDPHPINTAVKRIKDGAFPNVDGLVIIKEGLLVFEDYFPGYAWDFTSDQFHGEPVAYNRDTLHNLASVTKSFTSTLVGIAIDRGEILSVDEKLFSYFPEYAHLSGGGKDAITLKHPLTMTSGLEWNENDIPLTSRSRQNDLLNLFIIANPLEFILGKPLVAAPGSEWYYNGGGTNLLGEIVRRTTGLRLDEFARKYLFDPLGITEYQWDFINPDLVHASGNLHLRPRDMAKLGYLFLQDGIWDGKQVVSAGWVREATSLQAVVSEALDYGYQWWLIPYWKGSTRLDSFNALGWGGQRITVIPELDLVIVLTGGNYASEDLAAEIISSYILPAVR